MTIVTKLQGGLGNQMFQYSCARHLSYLNNTDLKLDVSTYDNFNAIGRNYYMCYFDISSSVLRPEEQIPKTNTISKLIFKVYKPSNYVKEKHFEFDPEILTHKDGTYLDGYWQSEKYFKPIESIIRNEFKFLGTLNQKNMLMANKIKSCNAVSIHIRRGDYITSAKTNALYGLCSEEYYKKSIEYINKHVDDPVFFVFSNDPAWIQRNMNTGGNQIIVDINCENDAHYDLNLLSLCKHHVIANSTFSWWGAWLSENPEKIIITPEKWFDQYNLNTKDLIPEGWLKF